MIRKRVEKFETIVNLDGPDGNAFNLIGLAVRIMRLTNDRRRNCSDCRRNEI